MSQFIGFFSLKNDISRQERLLQSIVPQTEHAWSSTQMCLRCTSLPETIVYQKTNENTGFLVAGLGLQIGTFEPLTAAEWNMIFKDKQPSSRNLNGHFVAVSWQKNRLRFFTDALGLRTLFLRETAHGLFFSSRLDWLNQTTDAAKINPQTFGSHWLTFNGLRSDQALTVKTRRLGAGSAACFDESGLIIQQLPWQLKARNSNERGLQESLTSFFNSLSSASISLGLSGGLDSRLLLSQLLREKRSNVATHVFGPASHPDVEIAAEIAAKFDIAHRQFDDFDGCFEAKLNLAREYCCATNAIAPASTALRLAHYDALHAGQKLVIDGGFGEIGRRQFLNRLRLKMPSEVGDPDFKKIFNYLRYERGAFLQPDFQRELELNAISELQHYWYALRDTAPQSTHDFLDIFALRSRLPNYYAYEQARLDARVPNLMPFAQPQMITLLLNLPISERRNSRLFRRLIRKNAGTLAAIPLAKGTTTYPFSFGTIAAKIWTTAKTKFNTIYFDRLQIEFIMGLKEYILDRLHSRAVQQSSLYDGHYLTEICEAFYGGDNTKAGEIDWWLALEFWRQGNRIK